MATKALVSKVNDAIRPDDIIDRVIFFGKKAKDNISGQIIAANLDGSIDQTTQISFSFLDPGFKNMSTGVFKPQIPCVFEDYKMEVARVDVNEQSEHPLVTITNRSRIVRKLKNETGKKVIHNASPTTFIRNECKKHNIPYVLQKSAKRHTIARDTKIKGKGDPSALDNKASDWTTFQRLASEIGYVCFESAGTLYFGKPSWLLKQMKDNALEVHWGGNKSGAARPLKVPTVSKSIDSKITSVTVSLPISYYKQCQVGQAIKLSGVPEFNGHYLITSVNYDLMNATSLTVGAQTPDDPAATGWKKTPVSRGGSVPQDVLSNMTAPAQGAATQSGSASALSFVNVALSQVGKAYVYGVEDAISNPSPAAFDCSELVQWAAGRVGVYVPDGSAAQAAFVHNISVAQAEKTRGALLFLQTSSAHHVAISLGDGRTVEALNPGYGVTSMSATARSFSWTSAGLIPGMKY